MTIDQREKYREAVKIHTLDITRDIKLQNLRKRNFSYLEGFLEIEKVRASEDGAEIIGGNGSYSFNIQLEPRANGVKVTTTYHGPELDMAAIIGNAIYDHYTKQVRSFPTVEEDKR